MIADEQSPDPPYGRGRPEYPAEPGSATPGSTRTGTQRDRFTVAGVEFEYEIGGTGDPVVLIHAGSAPTGSPRSCGSLPSSTATGSSATTVPGTGAARGWPVRSASSSRAHCALLMRHLSIDRALVVGHSSSGNIALQLALSAPELVGSLALLETALLTVPSGPYAAAALDRYRAGDRAGAVDTWMRGVCGPDYRAALDRAVPGAFDQAVSDVDTFFGQELPALRAWQFGAEHAARITQPVLAVLGASSDEVSPVFRKRHRLLLSWLPNAEPFVLPGANHLLQVQNPAGMAERLAVFARDSRSAASLPVR